MVLKLEVLCLMSVASNLLQTTPMCAEGPGPKQPARQH